VAESRSGPERGGTAPALDGPVRAADPDRADLDRDPLDELRIMIVGEEREQLAALRARLDDPAARRRDVGEVLPQALVDHAADPRFTRALTPTVERAITASVRSNPGPLADALFPVMGPAIRKAVSAALAGMVETLNRTLEHSLSWRSLAWRLEALRTGKSFGEVMLLHTLVYRVEQVFLIERTSGLLLQHVTRGSGEVRDADMVSGMLTAIRDFVKDSFQVTDTESLDALRVGELTIWIEQGPHAVIAAVLRGTPPPALRTTLQTALERIHLEFADEFEQFRGDASVFEPARPALEECLQTEYHAGAASGRRTMWIAAAVVAIVLVAWAGLALRARSRWNSYVDALAAEPGIVVVSSGRRDGKYTVSGLRDPLDRDPATLLAASGLTPGQVAATWERYYAANPSLAVARARQVLQPPAGVTLDLKDGVLTTAGAPPLGWLSDAGRIALLIPGISRFDTSQAADASVRAAIAQLEGLSPLFAKGRATLAPGQDAVLRELVARAADMERAAESVGRRFRVEVIGHTDADGGPETNGPLSQARAALVRSALEAVAGDRLDILDAGVGSEDPLVRSDREEDKQRNRRVTVRVTATADSAGAGAPRR
jgi:OOP family OmpA-OmpF porin